METIGMTYAQAIYLHNACVYAMNARQPSDVYVAHLVYTIRTAQIAVQCFESAMEPF